MAIRESLEGWKPTRTTTRAVTRIRCKTKQIMLVIALTLSALMITSTPVQAHKLSFAHYHCQECRSWWGAWRGKNYHNHAGRGHLGVHVSRGSQRNYHDIIRQVGKGYWAADEQLDALCWISDHESRRPGVRNSIGCVGLFQLKNPPKWMIVGDAASETKAGCEYILHRKGYGTPLKAKAFWLKHHWY